MTLAVVPRDDKAGVDMVLEIVDALGISVTAGDAVCLHNNASCHGWMRGYGAYGLDDPMIRRARGDLETHYSTISVMRAAVKLNVVDT